MSLHDRFRDFFDGRGIPWAKRSLNARLEVADGRVVHVLVQCLFQIESGHAQIAALEGILSDPAIRDHVGDNGAVEARLCDGNVILLTFIRRLKNDE